MPKKNNSAKILPLTSKRSKVSQGEFPRFTLEKTLEIAHAIEDNFAGKGAAPHDIALSLDMVPTSGTWRNLCGASIGYGLTEGGYNATEMTLTELGKRIVAPQEEGDDVRAMAEAIQRPRVAKDFFTKYNKAKFPADNIAENILTGLGLPKDRSPSAVAILKENGKFCGVLKVTKTGLFVAIDSPVKQETVENNEKDGADPEDLNEDQSIKDFAKNVTDKNQPTAIKPAESNRVYISHGKSRQIVNQLKELLTFGKFEPIVSVERDTTSVPVPEKVFADMRTCSAAVIHVMSEGELLDSSGQKHIRINENVLIEIGAAIALYGKNFILLVEKGVKLPSNLQGLYRCEYQGDILDYDATMKLLKTFNEFRPQEPAA